jgi:hypothetical protein
MKRRDLMKALKAIAKELGEEYADKEGGNHTKVWIGGRQTTVARHNEINEITAQATLKHMRGE